ncbi:MAG: Na/Pi cotransporter family protein [Aestuariibacter sp.]
MDQTLMTIGMLVGGLGLFLLAIGMMTDGLKLAAGPSLRTMLSSWTNSPKRGIATGFIMTAIVQSSSAVTVASIGFVNAGLLTMRQALGVVYGSNVGTTMTAWLVALVGFKINIQAFALPMIGIGMIVRLVRPEGRFPAFGLALVGFGLFFVGIDVLKDAFEEVVQSFDIAQFSADGIAGIVTFLIIGIVMTILTQSSSAAIALTITAASSGLVGIYAAAALVIGANVGTTSTALIASLNATSHAKRVAAAQVIFNVATAVVALLILPILFFAIEAMSEFFGLIPEPSITLAMFHTIFNVLGVLLVYPHNDRFVRFLEKHFKHGESEIVRPKFLDSNIATTPELAMNALMLEMEALSCRVSELCFDSFSQQALSSNIIEERAEAIKQLSNQVSMFIVSMESKSLSDETTLNLTTMMRVEQYFLSSVNSIIDVKGSLHQLSQETNESLLESNKQFVAAINQFVSPAWLQDTEKANNLEKDFSALCVQYEELKNQLLLSATSGKLSVSQMSQWLECIEESKRLVEYWYKAMSRLRSVRNELGDINKIENSLSAA